MRNTTVMKSAAVFFAAVSAVMLLSCGSSVKNEAFITFFTGTVSIQRSGAAVTPAIKAAILDGDSVIVGAKSCLVVQTTDGLVVRVEENTDAVISALSGAKVKEIHISRGKVLSLVGKLSKGSGYQVKTPTAVAAVRGTQFLTEYNGKTSVVAVGEGLVKVAGAAGAEEKIIDKGRSAIIGTESKIELRSVNAVENLELSKLSSTPVVDSITAKTVKELQDVFSEPAKNEEKINESILEESGLSLDELKKKYGRIDVISLFNGKVIQGVIVARGENFRVLTTQGSVYLDAKDVNTTDVK